MYIDTITTHPPSRSREAVLRPLNGFERAVRRLCSGYLERLAHRQSAEEWRAAQLRRAEAEARRLEARREHEEAFWRRAGLSRIR